MESEDFGGNVLKGTTQPSPELSANKGPPQSLLCGDWDVPLKQGA